MGRDGSKIWAPAGGRVAAGRSGSRIRVVACGAAAGDGTRPMRTHGTSSAADFVRYLELARRKWEEVPLITDNAPRHKSGKARRYLERTRTSCCCTCPRPGRS